MDIRDADPERDAAACAAIYAPHVEDGPTSFEEVAPDAAAMAGRIERARATHQWLVAEREGAAVGFAYACPHRTRAAYRWATDVSVYVAAGQRGQGVGRALYRDLLVRLRAGGFQVACAGITLPNEPSVALHESFGFEPVGVYRRIGWKAGRWRDVGWWQLELAPASADPPATMRACPTSKPPCSPRTTCWRRSRRSSTPSSASTSSPSASSTTSRSRTPTSTSPSR